MFMLDQGWAYDPGASEDDTGCVKCVVPVPGNNCDCNGNLVRMHASMGGDSDRSSRHFSDRVHFNRLQRTSLYGSRRGVRGQKGGRVSGNLLGMRSLEIRWYSFMCPPAISYICHVCVCGEMAKNPSNERVACVKQKAATPLISDFSGVLNFQQNFKTLFDALSGHTIK